MSCSSEPLGHTRDSSQTAPLTESDLPDTSIPPAHDPVPHTTLSERSHDVLRHVFPRPFRGRQPGHNRRQPRVTKSQNRKTALLSSRQPGHRVAFHKAITSFFHNSAVKSDSKQPQRTSASSSLHSHSTSFQGSLPSLEVVSAGTFIFSGPSLTSTRSESLGTSNSRLPSISAHDSESLLLSRINSRSLSLESPSASEEGILEPFVEHGITRSLSNVLLGLHAPCSDLEEFILEEASEDTLSESTQFISQSLSTPPNRSLAEIIIPYLDPQSRKVLRLTCRSWYSCIDRIAPPKIPPSFHVPIEILQHIYSVLGPEDFNAARHTCRNWMRASLNSMLLISMLKRGGWWSSCLGDLERKQAMSDISPGTNLTSDEWFLSKRLSRECALGAGWTGNGLNAFARRTPITEVSNTDFSDFANGSQGQHLPQSAGLIFTVSVCGRFLLIARETLIFIYDLQGSSLQPLTSVACPRRVLALSMDVSSGRNAVAALLEGRMGMVCELRFGAATQEERHMEYVVDSPASPISSATRSSIISSRATEVETGMNMVDHVTSRRISSDQDEQGGSLFNAIDVHDNHNTISLEDTDDHSTHDRSWINHSWNLDLRGALKQSPSRDVGTERCCSRTVPLETGIRTFYRHLCSQDDPPRSVAICPQRRCVAFGCSAGIELHWIDALTGQSLTRWFPLTAPSDYLFFLPPRPGFESAKKLRLISSATHPDERPAICRRFMSARPTLTSLWGSLPFENQSRPLGFSNCDHYHAVPLSDGHHILFIDPSSGKLSLGCDAPLGGPTKLLRKILLVAPEARQLPQLYTAAADLSSGARIVAVFGDKIMLYSIPSDIFALSTTEQKAESWDVYASPPFSPEGRSNDCWLSWRDEPNKPSSIDSNNVWPIFIKGTEIGTLRGVCELAIFTRPDLTIWAFTHNSQAHTYQVRGFKKAVDLVQRYVCYSGIVHDSYAMDQSGDVIMRNVDGSSEHFQVPTYSETRHSIDLDACPSQTLITRFPKALHIENDEWVDLLDVRGCEAWYDTNGDVLTVDTVL